MEKLKNKKYLKRKVYYNDKISISNRMNSLKEDKKKLVLEIENLKSERRIEKLLERKKELNMEQLTKKFTEKIHNLEVNNLKNKSLIKELSNQLKNKIHINNNISELSKNNKFGLKILKKCIYKLIINFKREINKSVLNDYEIKYVKANLLKNMINKKIENAKIISYLKNNDDILNFIDNKNHSILYYSVINCNKEVINILYNKKKIRFHKNEFFYNDKLKMHLQKIIHFYHSNNYQENILKYTFENNNFIIIKNLFLQFKKIKLDIICKNIHDIFKKVTNENIEIIKIIIKKMIKRGKSINDENEEGKKVIHSCILNTNNLEILKFIIEMGANVNDKTKSNYWRPIHFASAYNSNLDILKYLIKKGANIFNKTVCGFKPIFLATTNSSLKIFKYFSTLDSDIHYKNKYGCNSIYYVCKENKLNKVKFFLSLGMNIHEKNNSGKSGFDVLTTKNKKILMDLKLI